MEMRSLVIDVGSYETKAGHSGEASPAAVFPSLVGEVAGEEEGSVERLVGSGKLDVRRDAMALRRVYDSQGHVEDYEALEDVWRHAFQGVLGADVREYPVMMAEPTWNTRASRERMTELMFEAFEPPALFISKCAVLCAFQSARSTALVVDAGHSCTSVTPVHEGYALTGLMTRTSVGGAVLNEELARMLPKIVPQYMVKRVVDSESNLRVTIRDYPATSAEYRAYMESEVVRDVRQSTCALWDSSYVAGACGEDSTSYQLPDGQLISLGDERYAVPELYFTAPPGFAGAEPLSGLVLDTIASCEEGVKQHMYDSILLVGGCAQTRGFSDRLASQLVGAPKKTTVVCSQYKEERRFAAWVGGSILGSLSSHQKMWMTRAEYDEHGASFVESKCP